MNLYSHAYAHRNYIESIKIKEFGNRFEIRKYGILDWRIYDYQSKCFLHLFRRHYFTAKQALYVLFKVMAYMPIVLDLSTMAAVLQYSSDPVYTAYYEVSTKNKWNYVEEKENTIPEKPN